MVISLRKLMIPMLVLLLALTTAASLRTIRQISKDMVKIGGLIHTGQKGWEESVKPVFENAEDTDLSERFQRPSKQPALTLKYQFRLSGDFDEKNKAHIAPGYPKIYDTPEAAIHAYYSILKEASNMLDYGGGCGTIGLAQTPYPFAYELLSPSTKKQMPLKAFVNSFAGTGHMTLLKMLPAYKPANTPANLQYYMVEAEVITGLPSHKREDSSTYFAYYYGLVTAKHTPLDGWKIRSVDYIPEDFLCAPYHHWDWDAKGVVEIIYQNWYGLIDKITNVEVKDAMLYVYASGQQKEYRFDFVSLTNGYDIMLHENMKENGQWKEVNLLKEEHLYYKLSIMRFMH